MGTMKGMEIADRAWVKVNEETGGAAVRWPSDEALDWINDAQREIVNLNHKAYTQRGVMNVVPGSRQELVAGGLSLAISLVDVYTLMDSTGTTRVRALTRRPRAWLDDNLPTWHVTPGDPVHWVFDESEPTAFWIYPQPTAGRKIELAYAASPAPLPSLDDVIVLSDIYANAIQYFLLFSFYSKDTTYTKSPQMAANYYQLFRESLGAPAASTAADSAKSMADATGQVGVAS